MLTTIIFAMVLVSSTAAAQAAKGNVKSDCSPTPEELHQMAAGQLAKSPDEMDLLRAMDASMGFSTAYMNTHPGEVVFMSDALGVVVTSPYRMFRDGIVEAFRKREPLTGIQVPAGVVVSISPMQIDAPDIVKLIVARDGKEVRPIVSALRPKEFTTRMGVKFVVHAGTVVLPCSAFAPGAAVVVTAIPDHGGNIIKTFSDAELMRLK
jgi:hypothetical protein